MAYPRSKKKLHYENVIVYWEESYSSKVQANKCGLFQIHLGDPRGGASRGNFCYFYHHLSLETVFPAF